MGQPIHAGKGESRLEERAVLLLLCFFPLSEYLATWFPWLRFILLAGILGAASLSLIRSGVHPRPPLAGILLVAWILIQVLRAPNWDRSVGLAETWGLAFLAGWLASRAAAQDPHFPLKVFALLWFVASLLSAVNPGWQTPVADMEEMLRTQNLDEAYKQAVLHAASQNRYHFPFGNPIDLGVFLCLSLAILPALWRVHRQIRPSLIISLGLMFTAAVQIWVFWGTKSRTSLVGLVAAIGVWLAGKGWVRKRLILAGGVILVVLAAALVVFPSGREMISRTETIHARLIFWETALRMVRDVPFLGYGVGGYGAHYPRYRDLTPHQTLYPHNLFLESMTDLGAVGVVLLVLLLIRYFRLHSAPIERQPPGMEGIRLGGMAALAAFFASVQFGFHQDMLYIAGIAAIIGGACLSRRPCQLLDQAPSQRVLVSLLLLFLFFPACFREIGHARYERAATAYEISGDPTTAGHEAGRAIQVWPPLSEAYLLLSSLAHERGDLAGAEALLRKAIYWDPTTGNLHQSLAGLLWETGRQEEALREIETAIALHPVRWDYHGQRSRWLFALGRKQEAAIEREAGEALRQYEPRYEEARKMEGSSRENP
jgi:O-antigen ligase